MIYGMLNKRQSVLNRQSCCYIEGLFVTGTISNSRTLVPIIGQNFNGSVDEVFAYDKVSEYDLEGVLGSTPVTGFQKPNVAIFLSHIGSYDARFTYALDQQQRPALLVCKITWKCFYVPLYAEAMKYAVLPTDRKDVPYPVR